MGVFYGLSLLDLAHKKIDVALTKALHLGNGIYPTYLVHEVIDYEKVIENYESILRSPWNINLLFFLHRIKVAIQKIKRKYYG